MGATKEHAFERVCALYRKRSQLLSANVFVAFSVYVDDIIHEPRVGMVIEVHENAEDGDYWTIVDTLGEVYRLRAEDVMVLDHERFEDLYQTAIRTPHDVEKRPR